MIMLIWGSNNFILLVFDHINLLLRSFLQQALLQKRSFLFETSVLRISSSLLVKMKLGVFKIFKTLKRFWSINIKNRITLKWFLLWLHDYLVKNSPMLESWMKIISFHLFMIILMKSYQDNIKNPLLSLKVEKSKERP